LPNAILPIFCLNVYIPVLNKERQRQDITDFKYKASRLGVFGKIN
jgi:hypothetical protein